MDENTDNKLSDQAVDADTSISQSTTEHNNVSSEVGSGPASSNEDVGEQNSNQNDVPTQNQNAVVQSGNKSKKPKIILTLFIIALVALLGFLGWKAFLNKEEPTKSVSVSVAKKDIPVLNISVNPTPVNGFYPNEDQYQAPTYLINSQIYEGLVKYDDISKIKPQLATSWTNPNDETWVFTLKKNVKFHSGNIMTAKDVKYSLDTYIKKAYGGVLTAAIKQVNVVNDNQVTIVTDGPDPLLLHKLANLAIVDSQDKNKAVLSGTGPYTVKQGTTPTENSLDLVAFNSYHGGHVYVKELKISGYDEDSAQIDAVLKRKSDYAIGFATQSEVNKLKERSVYKLVEQEGLGSSYIGINNTNSKLPLASLKVRQAMSFALNRQQIVAAADLSARPSSQLVTQEVPGYNPSIKITKQDIAKAKQVLTEAGYPNGFTFTLTYVTGLADKQANEIASQLKQIGITTRLDALKDFNAYNEKWSSGKLDAFIEGYTSDLFDASDVYNFMVNNNPYYSNKQVSDLLDKANSTLDQTKRLSYLQQASKILNDDLNVIPTYVVNLPRVYKSNLEVQPNMYVGPYFWQIYQK